MATGSLAGFAKLSSEESSIHQIGASKWVPGP
jgi:hypothetical protein